MCKGQPAAATPTKRSDRNNSPDGVRKLPKEKEHAASSEDKNQTRDTMESLIDSRSVLPVNNKKN